MSNGDNGNQRQSTTPEQVLRPSGGYENLKVYKLAMLIQDITVHFVDLYIPPASRTCDQMVQAARSGKQNIIEGSIDAATSAKLELNLYNVARGSLEELKADYIDYLRQHGERVWSKHDPLAEHFIHERILTKQQFRQLIQLAMQKSTSVIPRSIPLKSVLVANATILLINVATFWLRQLIEEKTIGFLAEGGFSERLYRIRSQKRKSN